MTEIYHGPWSPVWGDVPEEKIQDAYHRYPVNKSAGVLKESVSEACSAYSVSVEANPEGNGK